MWGVKMLVNAFFFLQNYPQSHTHTHHKPKCFTQISTQIFLGSMLGCSKNSFGVPWEVEKKVHKLLKMAFGLSLRGHEGKTIIYEWIEIESPALSRGCAGIT